MQKILFTIALLTSLFTFSQDQVTAQEFQKNLNEEFADVNKSPLTENDRLVFKGLDFFPIDSNFIVKATFKRTKNEKSFEMKTTTDRKPLYVKYGEISFKVNEEIYKLNIYSLYNIIFW